jgi:hypothetical protein
MSRLCGVSTNAGHIHSDGTSGQVLTASLKLGTRLEHLHSCFCCYMDLTRSLVVSGSGALLI